MNNKPDARGNKAPGPLDGAAATRLINMGILHEGAGETAAFARAYIEKRTNNIVPC